ncbi:class I SAM-dependent methyltransferase [Candidatus Peregrinibacteria bacterium]|nr:class I SAM-dependent methyltransferase [Candidatus Peregrinibacteria bacterium]
MGKGYVDRIQRGPNNIVKARKRCARITRCNQPDDSEPAKSVKATLVRSKPEPADRHEVMQGNNDKTPKPGETSSGPAASDIQELRTHKSGEIQVVTPEESGVDEARAGLRTALKGESKTEISRQTPEDWQRAVMRVREKMSDKTGVIDPVKVARELGVVDHIESQIKGIYDSGDRVHVPSVQEADRLILLMSEFSHLYREGSLMCHITLTKRLLEERYAADKVYDRIHRTGELRFSQFDDDEPNDFAWTILKRGWAKPGDLFLEMGFGGGADGRLIARNVPGLDWMGVDISEHAVSEAIRITEEQKLSDQVHFRHGNYMDALRNCRGQLINGVYMHSTAQYRPRKVQEEILFTGIAGLLKPKRGNLYIAMKTGDSDSARSPLQIELAPESIDNPKIDLRHNCYRGYPQTEEDVHSLITPSGMHIKNSETVEYDGYDRPGEKERIVQLRAGW